MVKVKHFITKLRIKMTKVIEYKKSHSNKDNKRSLVTKTV